MSKMRNKTLRARAKALHWRVQSDYEGRFDELVLGPHVHLEMMDATCLWLCLGDHMLTINIRTGKRGPWTPR